MKTLIAVLFLTTNAFAYSHYADDMLSAQEDLAIAQQRTADAAERTANAAEDVSFYQTLAMTAQTACTFARVQNTDGTLKTISLANGKTFPIYFQVCNGKVVEGQ